MTYLHLTTCVSNEKSSWTCSNRAGTAFEGAVIRIQPLTRQNGSLSLPVTLPVQSKGVRGK